MSKKLTREQAAIIGAYTGVLCGPFEDVHELVEKLMGRPVFTIEMGNAEFMEKVRKLAHPLFIAIVPGVGDA